MARISALSVSLLVANVAAEVCPFSPKCLNSEGACATCSKGPWYETDHRCVCGTTSADWITEDQCTKCSTDEVAPTAASDLCPFSPKCLNSEGACATCNKGPWYDTDHRCVCGTASADWITEDQCTKCSTDEVARIAASNLCPFSPKCLNSEGACATCNKGPWYDTDHRCVCGTASADWITEDQCTKCSTDEVVPTAASDLCPFSPKCLNSEGACATCSKGPWYDTDHRCVCGTASADWITEDQCTKCDAFADIVAV